MHMPDFPAAAAAVFSSLPQSEAEKWMSLLPQHSAASFSNELTYAGWKHVPVSYLVCEDDKVLSPGSQRSWIELIERESENKVDVRSLKADHGPVVSATEEVVDWFVSLVGRE